jgi:hypothetical protein
MLSDLSVALDIRDPASNHRSLALVEMPPMQVHRDDVGFGRADTVPFKRVAARDTSIA